MSVSVISRHTCPPGPFVPFIGCVAGFILEP
jgi:hypothetical protein